LIHSRTRFAVATILGIVSLATLAGCNPKESSVIVVNPAPLLDGDIASNDASAACSVLLHASRSLEGLPTSPWVTALFVAETYASAAAREDQTWQKLAGDLTAMEAAPMPGATLPPIPVTANEIRRYWSSYAPLIADCAPLGVTLPPAPYPVLRRTQSVSPNQWTACLAASSASVCVANERSEK
jgi:hypothetical protein